MQEAGQPVVVREPSPPGDVARGFLTPHRLTDVTSSHPKLIAREQRASGRFDRTDSVLWAARSIRVAAKSPSWLRAPSSPTNFGAADAIILRAAVDDRRPRSLTPQGRGTRRILAPWGSHPEGPAACPARPPPPGRSADLFSDMPA